VDGKVVGHTNLRDRDVWEMERELLKQAISEMSPEELEQIEMLEQYEKALAKKLKEIGS
jgi:DNA-binding NtrC family response regulator